MCEVFVKCYPQRVGKSVHLTLNIECIVAVYFHAFTLAYIEFILNGFLKRHSIYIYIYICIYIYNCAVHTHTHLYTYMCIYIKHICI